MSWSSTRQMIFALGVFALIAFVGVGGYFTFFYNAPSCIDGILNQGEEGIDCGGACSHLCTQPNITTLWARSVPVAPGVYHAVAFVKNPQTNAQGTVPYTVSLFDNNNILVATREGTLQLLPGEIAPLFEANIVTGERIPARTFVDIRMGEFTKQERTTSDVRVTSFVVDEARGRLNAQIENQSLFPTQDTTVTALVYGPDNVVQYASQTILERLEAKEKREIVFTWQEPFAVLPVHVDVIARVLSGF